MPKLVILSVAAALSASVACSERVSAATAPTRVADALKIVALGDSLTSGYGIARSEAYPSLLEQLLREARLPFAVVNHGVSGDTTAGGVRRLRAALDERPQILIVALGANDGLRGTPVAAGRGHLGKIIETAPARRGSGLLFGGERLPLYGGQDT